MAGIQQVGFQTSASTGTGTTEGFGQTLSKLIMNTAQVATKGMQQYNANNEYERKLQEQSELEAYNGLIKYHVDMETSEEFKMLGDNAKRNIKEQQIEELNVFYEGITSDSVKSYVTNRLDRNSGERDKYNKSYLTTLQKSQMDEMIQTFKDDGISEDINFYFKKIDSINEVSTVTGTKYNKSKVIQELGNELGLKILANKDITDIDTAKKQFPIIDGMKDDKALLYVNKAIQQNITDNIGKEITDAVESDTIDLNRLDAIEEDIKGKRDVLSQEKYHTFMSRIQRERNTLGNKKKIVDSSTFTQYEFFKKSIEDGYILKEDELEKFNYYKSIISDSKTGEAKGKFEFQSTQLEDKLELNSKIYEAIEKKDYTSVQANLLNPNTSEQTLNVINQKIGNIWTNELLMADTLDDKIQIAEGMMELSSLTGTKVKFLDEVNRKLTNKANILDYNELLSISAYQDARSKNEGLSVDRMLSVKLNRLIKNTKDEDKAVKDANILIKDHNTIKGLYLFENSEVVIGKIKEELETNRMDYLDRKIHPRTIKTAMEMVYNEKGGSLFSDIRELEDAILEKLTSSKSASPYTATFADRPMFILDMKYKDPKSGKTMSLSSTEGANIEDYIRNKFMKDESVEDIDDITMYSSIDSDGEVILNLEYDNKEFKVRGQEIYRDYLDRLEKERND